MSDIKKLAEFLRDQSDTCGDHFWIAAYQIEQQQARIAELEKSVEWWQGCTRDCGDVINDGIESRQQLRAKVAELEAQAAIGRRAAGVAPQPYDDCLLIHKDGSQRIGRMDRKADCWRLARYMDCKGWSEVAWSLDDVALAVPVVKFAEPAAVAVDAGALDELREAFAEMPRRAYAVLSHAELMAEARVKAAVARLLVGGKL